VQRLRYPPLGMNTGWLATLHAHSIQDTMSRWHAG
jgi:hypothetical protein